MEVVSRALSNSVRTMIQLLLSGAHYPRDMAVSISTPGTVFPNIRDPLRIPKRRIGVKEVLLNFFCPGTPPGFEQFICCRLISTCVLWSKLLKGGYIGDYLGDYYRGY